MMTNKKPLIVFVIAISIILVISGYYFYIVRTDSVRAEKQEILKGIAELKITQISNWFYEKLDHTMYFTRDRELAPKIERLVSGISNSINFDTHEYLSYLKTHYSFNDVFVAGLDGYIYTGERRGENIDKHSKALLAEAEKSGEVVCSDLYISERDNKIFIDFIAPVKNQSNNLFAFLVFRIDPEEYLYPLIQSWPTSSESSETLIIRDEGSNILFLNEPRYKAGSALKLRVDKKKTSAPAIQAVEGFSGIFDGKDYRGVEVLSYLSDIPGTPWYMITKVDKDELYLQVHRQSRMILTLIFLTTALLWAGFAIIFNKNKKFLYKSLWEKEEEFRTTLYSIGDAVITTDKNEKVKFVNKTAEKLTGWSEKNAKNKHLEKIFVIENEITGEVVENPVKKVLSSGKIVGLANHTVLISANGEKIPIANSGAPIKNESDEIIGVVLVFRDQTKEREKQKEIEASEAKYRKLFTNTILGIAVEKIIVDSEGKPVDYQIVDINNKFEEILGYTREDVIGKLGSELYKRKVPPYLDKYSSVAFGGPPVTFETYSSERDSYFLSHVYSPEYGIIAVVFQDITSQKKIEQALEQRIIALTKPIENIDDLKFEDLFDLNEIQKIQDLFAESHGIASLITTPEGVPLTKPSNFSRFCSEFVRKSEKGKINCMKSDAAIGKLNMNGPTIQPCLSAGLSDAGASITVGGKHIANWLIGQVRSPGQKIEGIRKYAGELSLDEESFVEAFSEIPEMSNEKFALIAQTLYTIAKQLSSIAYQNVQQARFIAERKEAEEALMESRESFKTVADYTYDWEMWFGVNRELIYISPACERITGYRADEFYDNPSLISGIIYKDDAHIIQEHENGMFRENDTANIEFRIQRKDGKIRWINHICQPVYNRDGAWIGRRVSHSDFTDRKRLENIKKMQYAISNAALMSRSFSSLFKTIIKELEELVVTKNLVIVFHDEKEGMLSANVPRDEKDFISSWPVKKSLTGQVIKGRKTLLFKKDDILRLHASGEIDIIGTMPEVWIGAPVMVNESVFGAVVIQDYESDDKFDHDTIDILNVIAHELGAFFQRKLSEDTTRKLSKAVMQSPVIVLITSTDGTIEFVNNRFTEITGYSYEETIGKKPNILKSGKHSGEFYKDLWGTILKGENWQGEINNRNKNGELYWEKAFISPLKDSDGRITHFVAMKENITEKKKMIQELINAKEKAVEMNRLKTIFFANMSHELRTPFVGIMGYANLLAEILEDPEEKEMAEGIVRTSKRLTDTLSKILDLTKFEFDKTEINYQLVDLIPIANEVYAQFHKAAEQKGLELNKEYNPESILIRTDERLISEVLINLVNNAIKYTDEGEVKISVAIRETEKNRIVEIIISDTGIGIPNDKMELIFDEFRQASEGTTRSYQGTGLGLSIAKKYTSLLGGEITLRSEEGKGSDFILEFPLYENDN